MTPPSRTNVLGSQISVCDMVGSLDAVAARLSEGDGGYVCFANAHTVVMGRRDPAFRAITNGSFLSVADGKPVYWVGRANCGAAMGHVPGPDFFVRALERFRDRRHFLYGATAMTLERLKQALEAQIPGLEFCGTLAPSFRLTPAEIESHRHTIRAARPEFVWIGLGAPKQERWMAESWQALAPAVLFGVGAAFDFHAGLVKRAPRVLRNLGFEWAHRLSQEPRRLGRRYLVANSLFLAYLAADVLTRGRARVATPPSG
jgi:N-acetylglucosaminyldiphosphoundecaprenol N-acetyl-beta-D-mannosaminyltransferase